MKGDTNKDLRSFHKSLSWNTRIYTLLALVLIVFAKAFNFFNADYVTTILLALGVILLFETVELFQARHPRLMNTLKWVLLVLLIALLALGSL